ncbi:hypothetical protein BH09PSE3_BH09PSE3_28120 [soil metagenome]
MNRFTRLVVIAATSCLSLATPALAQSAQDDARFNAAQRRYDSEYQSYRAEVDRYVAARNYRGGGYRDPRVNNGYYEDDRVEQGYEPSRYYRDGPNYQERVLAPDDRVYRGNDGKYYCKRNDGTTGLIVGAVGGGVLGNVIDGGRSRTVGTLLGAGIGALAGRAVDQNNQQVKCR